MPTASSAPAVIAAPPGEGALLRGITFWPATMLVVGNVIGSAIFLTTGGMVEALPSASLVLAAWFAGGLMACAGGLTLAEMGAMLPRSGGIYVFLEEAYGPLDRVPLRLDDGADRAPRRDGCGGRRVR